MTVKYFSFSTAHYSHTVQRKVLNRCLPDRNNYWNICRSDSLCGSLKGFLRVFFAGMV